MGNLRSPISDSYGWKITWSRQIIEYLHSTLDHFKSVTQADLRVLQENTESINQNLIKWRSKIKNHRQHKMGSPSSGKIKGLDL